MNNNSAVTSNYQVEQRLNYNTIIGRHKLDAMVAMTYEKNSSEGINAFKRKALGNDEIYQILDAQTAGDNTSGGKETSSMLSYRDVSTMYMMIDTLLRSISVPTVLQDLPNVTVGAISHQSH